MKPTYDYNKKYLTKNSDPWYPIMGEIHYSRCPKSDWESSLYKMKAGGVEVISTYTIWIHHEEIEGEYVFEGNKDLRQFVKTCAKCGLKMFIRIGPWCHGEVRNGGLPDWLLSKDIQLRANNAAYFNEVEKFYQKIYDQVDGLMHKDGGPIIGVQIENEYGHAGGLQGDAGEEHMRTLYEMAKKIGFITPYYTATGWGGAVTGGLVPVMGGYCDAPWDSKTTKLEPNPNYIFTKERDDQNIASDHGTTSGLTFDTKSFPYLTAELGGGLQPTKHRRPIASAKDIAAMSLSKMGSGANMLGYYMYHGGTNPEGKLTTLQESKETGYPNDLPVLNYDFQAPIRQYGQISDTLKEIKLLSMFATDFGSDLCKMPARIPDKNPQSPDNLSDLRISYRHNGHSGYVFINNYQRLYTMSDHKQISIKVPLDNETIVFAPRDILDKDYFFYPYNMKTSGGTIKSAMATPLCRLDDSDNEALVFYTDIDPSYQLDNWTDKTKIITLSRKDALNTWKIHLDKDYLLICNSPVIQTSDHLQIISRDESIVLKSYPELPFIPTGFTKVDNNNEFSVYKKSCEIAKPAINTMELPSKEQTATYILNLGLKESVDDFFLKINYHGESAKLYLDGKMIADHFFNGEVWEIGLKHFDFPEKLTLEVYPLRKDSQVYIEKWPKIEGEYICKLIDISIEPEYTHVIY